MLSATLIVPVSKYEITTVSNVPKTRQEIVLAMLLYTDCLADEPSFSLLFTSESKNMAVKVYKTH
jgi:hypothetical protein